MTIPETVERYLQIWNQRDAAVRRASVSTLFTAACTYTDPMTAVAGHEAVDRFIGGVCRARRFHGTAARRSTARCGARVVWSPSPRNHVPRASIGVGSRELSPAHATMWQRASIGIALEG